MNIPAQTRVGMPMDEFIRLYDEAPFELIDGERILLMPPVARHALTTKRLYDAFMRFDPNYKLGMFFTESVFTLTDTPGWVRGSRVPDVMFYAAERWNNYTESTPDWEDKPFVLIPDICVEVISANDKYSDVIEKIERYLDDGVRLVLLLDPPHRIITIYRSGSNQTMRLNDSDILDLTDLLPDFSIPVRDIFG